jgi:dCTP diphosphatase
MSDNDTKIKDLKIQVADFIRERDWEQFHNPKDLAMSISIESAELMEIFQWKTSKEYSEIKPGSSLYNKVKEELADIIIYSISLSNTTGIDISEAIIQKLSKNSEKYPIDKARGNAKKYDEL